MMEHFDANYVKRLSAHMTVLLAYEDTALAFDEDRLMLAIVFVQNHCHMVLGELAPDIHARVEKK